MSDADKYESDETTSTSDAVKHYQVAVPAFVGTGTVPAARAPARARRGPSATRACDSARHRRSARRRPSSRPASRSPSSSAIRRRSSRPRPSIKRRTARSTPWPAIPTTCSASPTTPATGRAKDANEQRYLYGDDTQSNTGSNRQKETLALLTKGGWWDHTDGNRVTTTTGDKVEVIQGNYKMVVLGRQPLPPAPATGNLTDTQRTAIASWQALQAALDRIVAASGETLAALLLAESIAKPLTHCPARFRRRSPTHTTP